MNLPVAPPVLPMLANRVGALPEGDGWIFEPKWDGFRALVFRDGAEILIQSREGKSLNRYFGQMMVRATPNGYVVSVVDGPRVSGHRPSVDVLFRSVARAAGKSALGVILTGMGADGAQGLAEMRKVGAHTLGQDEASSVVYGMPKVAFELGAVERQVPLAQMPHRILAAI